MLALADHLVSTGASSQLERVLEGIAVLLSVVSGGKPDFLPNHVEEGE